MSESPSRDEAPVTGAAPAPEPAPSVTAPAPAPRAGLLLARPLFYGMLTVSIMALAASLLLWQKLSEIQSQLARQSADSGANAIEARTLARQAQELARETATRQAVTESRLGEVALQRAQLEELMQSLTRSRDENLVLDIEAALRLAQQQSQLTLSPEPLLAALRGAEQRLARSGHPRLVRVRGAITRDIDRIKAASVADVPSLLIRMDELARMVDELPLANAVGPAVASGSSRETPAKAPAASAPWWERSLHAVADEARRLVRVSRVDQPEAALLSPEQSFFLKENLKLKLLNARLSLLARQSDLARADLAAAGQAMNRYFDPAARRTQAAAAVLQDLQTQLRRVDLPRIDETLALLDATAASR
jgi:uroporphyrin-III C-methyltransferase